MFKIIGADGAEYGPYSIDELRKLIREGRANAATHTKPDVGGEWRPMGEYAEFADELRETQIAPPPLSVTLSANHGALLFGEICSEAWDVFARNAGVMIGEAVLLLLIHFGLALVPFVGTIVAFVLFGPLMAGPAWLSLKAVRRQPVSISDMFVGFGPHFVPLMLAGMVYQLFLILGIVLLILPVIAVMVLWSLQFFFILDRNVPFWDAMEASRRVTWQHFGLFLSLFFFALVVLLCGTAACLVGLLVAIPISWNLYAVAYNKLYPQA